VLHVAPGGNVSVSGLTVSGATTCIMMDTGNQGTSIAESVVTGCGIGIDDEWGVLDVVDSQISRNGTVGLSAGGMSGIVHIGQSVISENGAGLFIVNFAAEVVIEDTQITANGHGMLGGDGLRTKFGTFTIRRVAADDNAGCGFVFVPPVGSAYSVDVRDSAVDRNACGIAIGSYAETTIDNTTVSDNAGFGIGIADDVSVGITDTTISTN